MEAVAPEDLLALLVQDLERIMAPAASQRAWLAERGFPSDELMQQLDDALSSFGPRLRQLGLLNEAQEAAVTEVLACLNQVPVRVYRMDREGLDEPEWAPARRAAERALALFPSSHEQWMPL